MTFLFIVNIPEQPFLEELVNNTGVCVCMCTGTWLSMLLVLGGFVGLHSLVKLIVWDNKHRWKNAYILGAVFS